MTNQKAKNILNDLWVRTINGEVSDALTLGEIALEKQIPRKPLNISIVDANDNADVECCVCRANNTAAVKKIKNIFCWYCGQRLEWGDEDDGPEG